MRPADQPKKKRTAGMLGVGLDGGEDQETRITKGKNFLLCGGSEQTHSVMQETAIKINERLDRQGRRLEDVSPTEFGDICHDVVDSIGRTD